MKTIQLFNGEFSCENAPKAQLDDGSFCIPQHYLKYRHTLASVEELILKVDYSDRYPIFVSQDNQGIYLQVGIIGADNYKGSNYQNRTDRPNLDPQSNNQSTSKQSSHDQNLKIMYGRKWRVEPKLPSAEIVQTAFLAIKKVREHEVRELFRLKIVGKVTTPLNSHHDVTMLINSQDIKLKDAELTQTQLQQELDNIGYEKASFTIVNLENRNDHYWLLELNVHIDSSSQLEELRSEQLIVLIVTELTFNAVCYQLMAELIRLSDRHVDEHFTFSNVARFSQQNDIKTIAKISAKTRDLHKFLANTDFEKDWRNENYQVDLTRVPPLNSSECSQRIKSIINSFTNIDGILPDDV